MQQCQHAVLRQRCRCAKSSRQAGYDSRTVGTVVESRNHNVCSRNSSATECARIQRPAKQLWAQHETGCHQTATTLDARKWPGISGIGIATMSAPVDRKGAERIAKVRTKVKSENAIGSRRRRPPARKRRTTLPQWPEGEQDPRGKQPRSAMKNAKRLSGAENRSVPICGATSAQSRS